MPRLRNAASTQKATTATIATRATRGTARPALKEKTNTTRPSTVPVYEDDGNTEDLVKDAKPKRGRPRKSQQPSDELLMTSGLGLKDGVLEKENSDVPTTDDLAKSDNVAPPVAKTNRRPGRPVRKVLQNEKQSAVLDGLKQRMEATARDQRAKQTGTVTTATTTTTTIVPTKGPAEPNEQEDATAVAQKSSQLSSEKLNEPTTERSGLSLSPSPPPPGKLSTARRPSVVQPGSALRLQRTPAVEASIMALKNFKRRPRQPSMLQMVQQRTASTRPSLANTVAADTVVGDSSVFDLDGSDEEDDFAPEAEGTPLKATKKRQSSASAKRASQALDADEEYNVGPSSKKRKSGDPDMSSLSTSSTRSTRRKPSHRRVELPTSSGAAEQIALPQSSQRDATPLAQSSEIQVINSPSTSTPPTEPSSLHHHSTSKGDDFAIPSTEREETLVRSSPTPELEGAEDDAIPNGTMAEPLSSSPATRAVLDSFADGLKTTPPAKSPPKRKTKPMTTSMLQSMLPKKRAPLKPRHRKSEYDLESDSDDDGSQLDVGHLQDDEDELSRSVRRKKATPLKGIRRGRKATKKLVTAARKAPATTTTRKTTRTYGRATTSDKENEDYESADEEDSVLPEVSVSLGDASLSKELEDAKKKFAEVDDFDMEFESMSQEHHRSSSQGWR